MKKTFYQKFTKRFLDIFFSFLCLVILSPLLIILAIFQFIFNGLPLFFNQTRVGRDEQRFSLYKFRTMRPVSTQLKQASLSETQRLTWFGHFLRKSSLDELPSLINILNGTLSFVGPRPLLIEYLPLYSPRQKQRHLVTPGLTGLAQVKGRNSLSWKQKFEFDLYYVEHCSFLLDLKIIFQTIFVVLRMNGVMKNKQITAEKFTGNN
jgi:undecaprenyl phosphate N,N'-diacetylbacillosamine 1-phosphate transferase